MAKYYPTLSNQMLRKNAAARRTEWQSEELADFGQNEQASQRMQAARVQQRGIRQRYTKQPRMQAIKRAESMASEQGFRGRSKSGYVQQNWKKFL